MLNYEQDVYLEVLEQRHEARLIVSNTVRKPLKRDCLKYQACRTLLKKAYRGER